MVTDEFGKGRIVQHSAIEINSEWHMTKALEFFKQVNPRWKDVQVVVVDKDMKEVNVVKTLFPRAQILLCHFHVVAYWSKKLRKKEFPQMKKPQLDRLEDLMSKCVYAETRCEYEEWRDELHTEVGDGVIWDYFLKNWDCMTELWCVYQRHDLPHLGNNTNNRLESFHNTIKKQIKPGMKMYELLEVLMAHDAREANEYYAEQNRVGKTVQYQYDNSSHRNTIGLSVIWPNHLLHGTCERCYYARKIFVCL